MKGKNKKHIILVAGVLAVLLVALALSLLFLRKPVHTGGSEAEDSLNAPYLVLDHNNVFLGPENSFIVEAKVYWKGKAVKKNIEYTWEQETESDVASIKTEGNRATITGNAFGETAFLVSAEYKGSTLVQKLSVCVSDVSVIFDSPNMQLSDGCYEVNLVLLETEEEKTSIIPEIYVYDENGLVKDPVITWTPGDETIAVMDDDGRIIARKAGTTTFIGKYKNSEIHIRVNVRRTQLEHETVYIEAEKNYTLSFQELCNLHVEDVILDGVSVLKSYHRKSGIVQLDKSKLPQMGISREFVIIADKVEIHTDAMVVTKAIRNEADLNGMASVITKNNGAGYYVLANDITCRGEYDSQLTTEFTGTFDGLGHVIYDMATVKENKDNRGLFGFRMGQTSVLKNVSFVNAEHYGGGAFIALDGHGTLENVFLQIKFTEPTDTTAAISTFTIYTFAAKNVLVECLTPPVEGQENGYALGDQHIGFGKYQGLFVIGANQIARKSQTWGDSMEVYGAYMNYEAFLEAKHDVSGWKNDFWDVKNGIPYPKSLESQIDETHVVKIPDFVGAGSDVILEGYTIYEKVILSAKMIEMGFTVENGVLHIPSSVPTGTKISFTVQSVFNSEKSTTLKATVLKAKTWTMSKPCFVEIGKGQQFSIDLKDYENNLKGKSLYYVSVDGKTLDGGSYKNGKLTLNVADMGDLGIKTVDIVFKDSSSLGTIRCQVDICTYAIDTVEEFNKLPEVLVEHNGEGRYVLVNDITYTAEDEGYNGLRGAFAGTFDGRGHTIYNMYTVKTNDEQRGLFGWQFKDTAVLENVSFVNAEHYGRDGFIALDGAGTMENVYLQIKLTNPTETTAAIATFTNMNFVTKNVLIEYLTPLSVDAPSGYVTSEQHLGFNSYKGLYVIGADKVGKTVTTWMQGQDDYAAYRNYSGFVDAGKNLSSWENDFWAVKNGIPYPKNLGERKVVVPQVTVPEYVGIGTKVVVDGLTIYDRIVLGSDMKKYGVTITDGVVTVPNTVPVGTKLTFTVQSVFDSSKSKTLTMKALKAETVHLTGVFDAELYEKDSFAVDFGKYADKVKGMSLFHVSIEGKVFQTYTYENGILTLDTKSLDNLGEQTAKAMFKSETQVTTVEIPVDVCTYLIENVDDLNAMPGVIAANSGIGRYVLANDITYTAEDEGYNGSRGSFSGTFDGRGYTIYNMYTVKTNDEQRGLFGWQFKETAVLKNVSFVNAEHYGRDGFIALDGQGTIENVYLQIKLTEPTNTTAALTTFTIYTFAAKNVFVEYLTPLSENAEGGYVLGEQHLGFGSFQGLYVIGADRVGKAVNTWGEAEEIYGAYANYADFVAAGNDVSKWDKEFWTITKQIPYPVNLEKRQGSVPNVSLPEITERGITLAIEGATIYDKVILGDTFKNMGITVKKNALVIPETVPYGTTISVEVQSIFDSSKTKTVQTKVLDSEKITASKTYDVVYNDFINGEAVVNNDFSINLDADIAQKIGNTPASSITVGERVVANATYSDGVLTLDKASLGSLGDMTITLRFVQDTKLLIVNVPVAAYTMIINDEAELSKLPTVIIANNGEGYYILGNDIVCTGTYPGFGWNETYPFTGTFDGCGYNICNMKTACSDDWTQGFLGSKSQGTIKNVSFINAQHGGHGGFIATYQEGAVENVYIQIALTPYVFENPGDYWGGLRATSVVGGQTNMNARFNKVFIEYVNPLSSGTNCGHAVYQMHQGFGSYNGLYVIGAEKVMSEVLTANENGGDVYGAYANYADFVDAGNDVSQWDNEFWTITKQIPYPKNLGERQGSVPNVSLPEITERGITLAIEGATIYDKVILEDTLKNMGITVENNALVIPETVPYGTTISVEVQSIFDSSKTKTVQTKVLESETINVAETHEVAYNDFIKGEAVVSDNFAINLDADIAQKIGNTAASSITVGDQVVANATYSDGVLTIDKACLGGLGNKTITLRFVQDTKLLVVNIQVAAYTMVINDEAELNKLPTVILANNGEGYYILGNDIVCSGIYPRCNWDAKFTGTFDGCGNNIYNLTTAHSEGDWYQGFLGVTSTGILKNVSFINAKHGGCGGFIATYQEGTVENVYIQIELTPYVLQNAGDYWGGLRATSVVGGQTNMNTRVNKVFIEYVNPLPNGTNCGHAVYQMHQGFGSYNGLYVIGAEKVMSEVLTANENGGDVYGAYASRDAFKANEDVSAWENEFWTVVDGIPTPKKLRPINNITLEGNMPVEASSGSTFKIDLSSVKDTLSGGRLVSAAVDGKDFTTFSYAEGTLTLDTATLSDTGAKKVTAVFAAADGSIVFVNATITVCTMIINNEAELNTLPSTIYANGGAGYYALGNDIVCTGTYPRCEWDAKFTGTFDGCGNVIYNLTTAHSEGDWYQGFLGVTSTGILNNVSFINAKHGGCGGFIATYQEGTVENVYIQIELTPYVLQNAGDYWGGLRATSVVGGQTNMNTRVNKVFIEYINPLPNGTNCGHAVYQMHQGFGSYNGLYVIGAEKVMSEVLTSNVGDTYGAYASRDAFKANADVSAWENEFWTVVDGIPTPKKLR